ncbi:hypothetical protein Tco_0596103 [Tanacetum coccineum]
MPPKKTPMTDDVIKELIDQGVTDALADYKANRSSGNGNDSHNSGSGGGRTPHTARVCTYKDFLNCQPLNFKGIAGIVGLTQWFEKMEFVFHINNYTVECQVKYVTCTLLGSALTWSEIKKLEIKLMLLEESDQVEKYVGGLPNMIQGNVMFAKPKTMQEAIEPADDLMDQKVRTYAEKQAENKTRLGSNSSDNNAQQPPFKRQDVARAYVIRASEKEYARTLPLCNKCKFHHNAPCTIKCANYKRVSHLTRDCRNPVAPNNQRTSLAMNLGIIHFVQIKVVPVRNSSVSQYDLYHHLYSLYQFSYPT